MVFTGSWDDTRKWLRKAAKDDPVAVEIFCQDTADLVALLSKFPEGDDSSGEIVHNPIIRKATHQFAEHMVRLRKAHYGAVIPGEKMEVTADCLRFKADPNPDGTEGYLLNEFATYVLLAQTLTPVCCRFKRWIANNLMTEAQR
jgi:hypothetical protein